MLKQLCAFVSGIGVIGEAVIPLVVSPTWTWWRVAIVLFAVMATSGLAIQLILQWKEEKEFRHEQQESTKRFDELIKRLEPVMGTVSSAAGSVLRDKVLRLGHDLLEFLKGAPEALTAEDVKSRSMSVQEILNWGLRERGSYVTRIHYGYLSQFKDRTISLFNELQAHGIDVSEIQEWEVNPPQMMRAATVRKIAEECFLVAARMDAQAAS